MTDENVLQCSELEEAKKLLSDYAAFTSGLMWEIENLSKKLRDKEPEGWEGSKRRGVYQPAEHERLTNRLKAALYTP